jgi:hypothetical protein
MNNQNVNELEKIRLDTLHANEAGILALYKLMTLFPQGVDHNWLVRRATVGHYNITLVDFDCLYDRRSNDYVYNRSLRIVMGDKNKMSNELMAVRVIGDNINFGIDDYIYQPEKWLDTVVTCVKSQAPNPVAAADAKRLAELRRMLVDKDPV